MSMTIAMTWETRRQLEDEIRDLQAEVNELRTKLERTPKYLICDADGNAHAWRDHPDSNDRVVASLHATCGTFGYSIRSWTWQGKA